MTREAFVDRSYYRHWQAIQTRWSDNDVYGHINNTVYYQWFDLAVNNWLIAEGLLDIVDGDRIGLVVETRCRYASALAYPELVDVGLAVDRLGTSSVTYGLGVFAAGSDKAAAEGVFTHVYVDRQTRRPAPLPDNWRKCLGNLTQSAERQA